MKWAAETDDLDINEKTARLGSLDGFGEVVRPAGERAIELGRAFEQADAAGE